MANRLLFDGNRILDDQTAGDLDIEDGDAIEVLLERKYSRLLGLQRSLTNAEVGGRL
jgi:hypothetical protein